MNKIFKFPKTNRLKGPKRILIPGVIILLLIFGGYYLFSNDLLSRQKQCDTNGCFQQAFLACDKASLQQTNPIGSAGAEFYYETKGGTPGRCRMSASYFNGTENLVMSCVYRDTKRYDIDSDDGFIGAHFEQERRVLTGKPVNCEGSLYEDLVKQGQDNPSYGELDDPPSRFGTE